MGTIEPVSKNRRRDYGSGSIFKRADGTWIGRIEIGWDAQGDRRRVQVSARTEAECKRRLVKRRRQLEVEGAPVQGVSDRATVKMWADKWLEHRADDLRPATHGTYSGAVRKWIVPTIGHKRLSDITPGDLRAVTKAETDAGNAVSSARQTRRVLVKMLRDALVEGHHVPPRVLEVKAPATPDSDTEGIELDDALKILAASLDLPDRSRWLAGFLQGVRQGEALGLTWEHVDLEAGTMTIKWQLGTVPYLDREREIFRLPKGVRARHLWKSYHLMPPKTKKGERVIPLVEPMRLALAEWKELSPASPHGLVWPRPTGEPRNAQKDSSAFVALQEAAGVAHEYTIHQMRHTTATLLLEAGVDPKVIEDILGHSSIVVSRGYMHVRDKLAREAMEKVAGALKLDMTKPRELDK